MDYSKIKREAREILKGNLWNILKPMLVLFAIYFVIGFSAGFGSANVAMGDASQQSTGMNLVTSILEFLAMPIGFGVLVYEVKLVRKKPYELKEIFAHYSKFWPIFCLSFLVGLFTFLWSLLLLIPGIIAAISYSQAMLLMVDGENDPMECIKQSKAMMYGYKWDYFVFHLSFILWYLLGLVTFGLAFIYVGPYVQVAEILYYEELRKVHKK